MPVSPTSRPSGEPVTGTARRLADHVAAVRACVRCPRMRRPAVPGYPAISRTLLIGQAPGRHEPVKGRPFAWTAGRTLFAWFREGCGVDEERFRRTVYMAAVCRCFPGETPAGGDRVPDRAEIVECSHWLRAEFEILRPELVIPVGRLAIVQLLPPAPLTELIGQQFRGSYAGHACDVIPLPHPSGASPWPRIEPGKSLTRRALELIRAHPGVSRDRMKCKKLPRWVEALLIIGGAVLMIVFLPVILPVVAILDALAQRRMRTAAEQFHCLVCGQVVGRAGLDRADGEWLAHVRQLHADNPGVKFRLVRRLRAVCPHCDTRYDFDEKTGRFSG